MTYILVILISRSLPVYALLRRKEEGERRKSQYGVVLRGINFFVLLIKLIYFFGSRVVGLV